MNDYTESNLNYAFAERHTDLLNERFFIERVFIILVTICQAIVDFLLFYKKNHAQLCQGYELGVQYSINKHGVNEETIGEFLKLYLSILLIGVDISSELELKNNCLRRRALEIKFATVQRMLNMLNPHFKILMKDYENNMASTEYESKQAQKTILLLNENNNLITMGYNGSREQTNELAKIMCYMFNVWYSSDQWHTLLTDNLSDSKVGFSLSDDFILSGNRKYFIYALKALAFNEIIEANFMKIIGRHEVLFNDSNNPDGSKNLNRVYASLKDLNIRKSWQEGYEQMMLLFKFEFNYGEFLEAVERDHKLKFNLPSKVV